MEHGNSRSKKLLRQRLHLLQPRLRSVTWNCRSSSLEVSWGLPQMEHLTWAELFWDSTDKGKSSVQQVTDGPEPTTSGHTEIIQVSDQAGPFGSQNQTTITEVVTKEVNGVSTDLFQVGEKYYSVLLWRIWVRLVKIESKSFKFAVEKRDLVLFEFKKSFMHKIQFKLELVPQIIGFIYQLRNPSQSKFEEKRRFRDITISVESNRAGYYVKLAKQKGIHSDTYGTQKFEPI
ncbi:unnamed protein product [Cuscuta europaea]|uniref:Uncharacterized protein n=1 Tax=Cuscuta europaea TaxID=41803 RepID=A0A9P1A0A4_CUSEU|nr:unnamed protein product [Cuscuta europaea]